MKYIIRDDVSDYDNKYITYSIRMISSNKYYVGYTNCIISRIFNKFYGHIGSLKNSENIDYIHKIMRENPISDFELLIEEIHNSKDEAKLHESFLVDKYDSFNNGFNMTNNGHGGTGGRIRVTNRKTKQEEFIKPSELDDYIRNGYRKGSDRVVVSPPEGGMYNYKFKRIKSDDLRSYLDKGFTIGSKCLSTTKGNIFMYKGDDVISVKPNQVGYYLSLGYIKGFSPNSGGVHYYSELTGEIRLFKDLTQIPSEFKRGKCLYAGKYKMTDGVNIINVNKGEEYIYIHNGYKFTK